MRFRERTRDAGEGVLLYTVIPPPVGTPPEGVWTCAEHVHELALEAGLDAVNIPEVRNEVTRPGPRTVRFVPKIEPRRFAKIIQTGFRRPLEAIVDRGIVYTHWANQRRWLCRTYKEFGVRTLVLVGGESSRIRYTGPGVVEAASRIRRELKPQGVDFFLGGITIPQRRNEPERLIQKAQAGLEFFTSQVLYESKTARRMLRAYDRRCRELGIEPKRVFLSFAPVSSQRDLEFLKWLGVEIPEAVEKEILNGWIGTAWRSIKVAERVLGEILAFARDEKLSVPLGINVEHVMKHNFEVSRDMALALRELYCRYLRCTRRPQRLRREGIVVRL